MFETILNFFEALQKIALAIGMLAVSLLLFIAGAGITVSASYLCYLILTV